MKAWISYVYEDKGFVERIEKFLKASGVEILNEKMEILPGDNILAARISSIAEADLVLVIISKSVNNSPAFALENGIIVSAIENHQNKKLIPILREENISIPPFINQYQALYLPQDKLEYELDLLLKSLGNKSNNISENSVNINKVTNHYFDRDFDKEKLYNFLESRSKYDDIKYQEQIKRKERAFSISLLTAILTSILSVFAVYATMCSISNNVKKSVDTIVTESVSSIHLFNNSLAIICISVIISTVLNFFLNRLYKK